MSELLVTQLLFWPNSLHHVCCVGRRIPRARTAVIRRKIPSLL